MFLTENTSENDVVKKISVADVTIIYIKICP